MLFHSPPPYSRRVHTSDGFSLDGSPADLPLRVPAPHSITTGHAQAFNVPTSDTICELTNVVRTLTVWLSTYPVLPLAVRPAYSGSVWVRGGRGGGTSKLRNCHSPDEVTSAYLPLPRVHVHLPAHREIFMLSSVPIATSWCLNVHGSVLVVGIRSTV